MVDLDTASDAEIATDAKLQASNGVISSCFQKGIDGQATQDEIDALTAKVAAMVAAPDPE